MKTMTCRELGGICDQKLTAVSWNDMVRAMTRHVMEKHPAVAKEMGKMHSEDPPKWGKGMNPTWDAAPAAYLQEALSSKQKHQDSALVPKSDV
jgi:hypothetical protein